MNGRIVVIGAGPTGLIAAHAAARGGHDVTVFEEHGVVGKPDHCAGLVSLTGLASLGLRPPSEVIDNKIVGARIHSPSGSSFMIERGRNEAVVLCRQAFDCWLATRAITAGAGVEVSSPIRGLIVKRGAVSGVYVGKDRLEREAGLVIDAEGFRGRLIHDVGMPTVKNQAKLPAYQYEVRSVDIEENIVELFYGRRIAPGFFAWIIPRGDGRARVGLAARNMTRARLDAAIRHHPVMRERLKGMTIERGLGGVVISGMPVKRTHMDGLLVVGDAAGMVKATTGGGIVMGGTAALLAGRTASEAMSADCVSSRDLVRYEDRWRGAIMSDLRSMYVAQKLLSSLSDKGLDALVSGISEHGLMEIVKREGDMDRQRRVIVGLMKKPKMLLTGVSVTRYLLPLG
ncbi:MAG: NAD(P)/FAD-dependent oxidoreductase [Candidatus Thorarchaeota archaeon]|nr:NAD(P)/FAD-dependent oxidoreductase [Candidatus Thorarchaeota archaeon]